MSKGCACFQDEDRAAQGQRPDDDGHHLGHRSLHALEAGEQLADVVEVLEAPLRPLHFSDAPITRGRFFPFLEPSPDLAGAGA